MAAIDAFLWGLTTALPALAFARLCQEGLVLRYRAFASMLGIGVLRDLLLMLVPYQSHNYSLAWSMSLPPLLVTHAWTAVASYQAIAGLYPKIGVFATRLLMCTLTISAIACGLMLPFENKLIGGEEAQVRCAFLAYRWMDSLAAGGLLLAVLFLSRYPAPLKVIPANLRRHTGLLAAYFTAYGITCLAENLAPLGSLAIIERVHFGLVALLYVGWCTLTASGERAERWPGLDPETARWITARNQLAEESYNAAALGL